MYRQTYTETLLLLLQNFNHKSAVFPSIRYLASLLLNFFLFLRAGQFC